MSHEPRSWHTQSSPLQLQLPALLRPEAFCSFFHVPAEAKGTLENKDLPEKSAPAENGETQKEEAEHNHIQRAEPQEGKTLQEPTGRI